MRFSLCCPGAGLTWRPSKGWEATRRLKADDATKAVPVIALTAHAMSTDREQALAAGCDGYETKPVDLPRLLEAIEKLLP